MRAAQYYALLARALPGTPFPALQWDISLVMGWSLIHASGILHGGCYIWPDPRLSRVGRLLIKARQMRGRKSWGQACDL